jgi:hypothetical protein
VLRRDKLPVPCLDRDLGHQVKYHIQVIIQMPTVRHTFLTRPHRFSICKQRLPRTPLHLHRHSNSTLRRRVDRSALQQHLQTHTLPTMVDPGCHQHTRTMSVGAALLTTIQQASCRTAHLDKGCLSSNSIPT